MESKRYKQRLFEEFAALARALGHRHRLELLELLAQGERSVDDLAARCDLSVANASQHLQRLRRLGLLESRREQQRIFYRLADDEVVALLSALRRVAERNVAQVRQIVDGYFGARDTLEPVSCDELRRRLAEGVVILDVRPPEEFAAGHLPGAVNIPLSQLPHRLGELPRGREVIAYCRGPYCVLSLEAVAWLRQHGFTARRLAEGLPEWRWAGLPVEFGQAGANRSARRMRRPQHAHQRKRAAASSSRSQ